MRNCCRSSCMVQTASLLATVRLQQHQRWQIDSPVTSLRMTDETYAGERLFHFLVVNTFLALCAKTKHCREDNQWRERLLLCLTEKCVCVCVYCAQILFRGLITGFSLSWGYSSTILYFPVTFHGSLMNVQLKSKWAFAYRTDYTCGGTKATTWMQCRHYLRPLAHFQKRTDGVKRSRATDVQVGLVVGLEDPDEVITLFLKMK